MHVRGSFPAGRPKHKKGASFLFVTYLFQVLAARPDGTNALGARKEFLRNETGN